MLNKMEPCFASTFNQLLERKMSFWSTAGNIAKDLAKHSYESMKKTVAEIEEFEQKYRNEDDDFLKNTMRNGNSINQKTAAKRILKERGYDY